MAKGVRTAIDVILALLAVAGIAFGADQMQKRATKVRELEKRLDGIEARYGRLSDQYQAAVAEINQLKKKYGIA